MPAEAAAATDVRPFRALRFDPERVRLADVVTPPYDVIDAGQRARFLARSPFSVAHLILPEPGSEDAAGRLLGEWLEAGVLVADEEPAVYWLEQRFPGPAGERLRRAGAIAALRLAPYGAGAVRPHERTLEGPKANRLALMRAVQANLSPIFAIHDDPEHRVEAAVLPAIEDVAPVIEVHDADGTQHRLWRGGGAVAEQVAATLADGPVTIADGHHRYETALRYRDERRAADHDPEGDRPYDFAPVYLANRRDPG